MTIDGAPSSLLTTAMGPNPEPAAREVVGSGERRLSRRRRTVLEAFLGSCVGVTLCDRRRGIGGMIHLLLPHPVGPTTSIYAARYASIGLPKFIEELARAGADKSDLRACYAGGALVGEISALDLDLDIGGRTAAVVEQVLSAQRIPIVKMETGGFFTCKMTLDLSSFETTIEPVVDRQDHSNALARLDLKRDLPSLLQRIKPIPQVALKILRMIEDQNYLFSEIAEEVRQDQTVSAKVLHICNSSFFGRGFKVDSIDRALTQLGEKNLIKFVVSAFLEQFFFSAAGGYSLCKAGLYQHALATARLAERLASMVGVKRPDLAYTAGLLHDIGKIALDQYLAHAQPFFYREVMLQGRSAIDVERELFAVDHTVLGEMIGQYWEFPAPLREVTRRHHAPESAELVPELVNLVHLSDLVLSRFRVDHELERIPTHDLALCLSRLGLSAGRLQEVVDCLLPDFSQPL